MIGEPLAGYVPIMHGNLKFEPSVNTRIVGFINWGPVFVSILLITIPVGWPWYANLIGSSVIALILFIYFGSIYLAQRKRFKAVAIAAASLNVDTRRTTE
jgi:MFS superfamily sulfate permease-like transporter